MKRRLGYVAVATMALLALNGTAMANESHHSRVDCGGRNENPGQAKQSLGAAGPDRFQTPVGLAEQLGNETPGESFRQYCSDSVGKP
jgi:hypothetical protein